MTKLSFSFLFLILVSPAWGSLHYAIIGDAGDWNKKTERVHGSITKAGVTRLILPGDNLYKTSEGYDSAWKYWKGFTFDVVAIGNHNISYKAEIDYFSMPGEYYAKVEPGVRFLVLNSDNETTAQEQAAWLEKELESATEEFVFVVYHHPSFTISPYHSWREKKDFHLAIRPVLFKHRDKLTALINGHDHMASLVEFNDLPVIVSGAVSDVRPTFGTFMKDPSGVKIRTRWLDSTAVYWADLELDPSSGTALVHFTRGFDSKTKCTARLSEKKVSLFSICEKPQGDPEG